MSKNIQNSFENFNKKLNKSPEDYNNLLKKINKVFINYNKCLLTGIFSSFYLNNRENNHSSDLIVNRGSKTIYKCPLGCNSKGFNNICRVVSHFKENCNILRNVEHSFKQAIINSWKTSKAIVNSGRKSNNNQKRKQRNILKIESIICISKELPRFFLCKIYDSKSKNGFKFVWIKSTCLRENGYSNLVKNSYRHLKRGKIFQSKMSDSNYPERRENHLELLSSSSSYQLNDEINDDNNNIFSSNNEQEENTILDNGMY